MNVGQILETHLGWAARASALLRDPVFDGATESEIKSWLERAGLASSGKTRLFDGMTGESFEQDVTVGYIYMLKLSHLVDDKITRGRSGRTRSSPSSRWGARRSSAASASGRWRSGRSRPTAPRTSSRSCSTAKSDDVTGRAKVYESIVKATRRSRRPARIVQRAIASSSRCAWTWSC